MDAFIWETVLRTRPRALALNPLQIITGWWWALPPSRGRLLMLLLHVRFRPVGDALARRAKAANVDAVKWTRPYGKRFHGKIASLMEALKSGGVGLL